eukprot:TRINITY_DN8000_c1_g3_i1.p1 TRINITY_DN8000_c1_g3~~TRINITY_DN8000_c1_g3_i1.p1  ORF type:complete len:387 (+),score=63.97 TRINITY_DN8000_c1_g3_i1:127-1287(+)
MTDMPDFIPLLAEEKGEPKKAAPAAKQAKRKHASATPKQSECPWVERRERYSDNPAIALHQEIVDFYEYIQPTEAEMTMRGEVVGRIVDVVTGIWPKAEVKVFGSFATGLLLPTSDVDLVVIGSWPKPPLNTLAKALKAAKLVTDMQVIAKARVPIIKFRDRATSVHVDISFNMPTGPEDALVIQQKMKELPAIRPLVLILKQFLMERSLNEVFTGGLGSYAIFLMVLSFLQMRPAVTNSRSNLGVLLLEFLELYGCDLNYEKVGICVRKEGKYFAKSSHVFKNKGKPDYLCIENPREPDLDVTWNSYNIQQIRTCFQHAYYTLSAPLRTRYPKSYRVPGSLLAPILHISQDTLDYRAWVERNFSGLDEDDGSDPAKRSKQDADIL